MTWHNEYERHAASAMGIKTGRKQRYNADYAKQQGLSHVGMANCYLCNKPKSVLLDRRLRNTLPKNAVYDKEPCDQCKDYMKQGVIIIGVRDNEQDHENPYRTGEWAVIKPEAVERMPLNEEVKKDVLNKRVMFMEQSVIKKLGLDKAIKNKAKEN